MRHEQLLTKQKGVRGRPLQPRQRSGGQTAQGHPEGHPGVGAWPERTWERWVVARLRKPEHRPAALVNLKNLKLRSDTVLFAVFNRL